MNQERANKNNELFERMKKKTAIKEISKPVIKEPEPRVLIDNDRLVDSLFKKKAKLKKKKKMFYLSEQIISEIKKTSERLEISENQLIEESIKYLLNIF